MGKKNLAMRDPALAAILGVLATASAVPSSTDSRFGEDAAAAAWARQQQGGGGMGGRGMGAKVKRYTFALNATIAALATPQTGLAGVGSPDTDFAPQRISINTPSVGFLKLTSLRIANLAVLVGGVVDAHQFNSNAVDSVLDMPTLSNANKAAFGADYSGSVPTPLTGTGSYLVCVAFTGPAAA